MKGDGGRNAYVLLERINLENSALQYLLDFILIDIQDERDAADEGGILSQGGYVIAGNVAESKFSVSGHELPQSLVEPPEVGVEPYSASRDFVESLFVLPLEFRSCDEDFFCR